MWTSKGLVTIFLTKIPSITGVISGTTCEDNKRCKVPLILLQRFIHSSAYFNVGCYI